jgi:hypothetical protein
MKEITVVAKNDVGSLAAVAEALGSVGVNIEAISAYAQNDEAIFRILTNDVTTALKTLSKIPNIRVSESEVIVLRMPNKPGELGKVTRKLANSAVNLESVYIVSKENNYTEVAIKPSNNDLEKAKTILRVK